MVQKMQVDLHHVLDRNEISSLLAICVSITSFKHTDLSGRTILIVEMERN